MNLFDLFGQPKWAAAMENRFNNRLDYIMALVSIEDTDLATFADAIEAETSAISTAVGVLAGYIQQLLDNQAEPLPAADESEIKAALDALTGSVSTLTALEPPTPAP